MQKPEHLIFANQAITPLLQKFFKNLDNKMPGLKNTLWHLVQFLYYKLKPNERVENVPTIAKK